MTRSDGGFVGRSEAGAVGSDVAYRIVDLIEKRIVQAGISTRLFCALVGMNRTTWRQIADKEAKECRLTVAQFVVICRKMGLDPVAVLRQAVKYESN